MHILLYILVASQKKIKRKKEEKKNKLSILFALRCESINDITFLLRNKSQEENFSFFLSLKEVMLFVKKFLWLTLVKRTG